MRLLEAGRRFPMNVRLRSVLRDERHGLRQA
jgi:hypothetical protein